MSAVTKFESMAGKGASLIHFSSPFADCSAVALLLLQVPRRKQMESIRNHGSIPFFSWASQSTPSSLDQPDFQLADMIAGTTTPTSANSPKAPATGASPSSSASTGR